ncbi:MAG: outer membrane homotrimeric porin [Desulfovibrionaceae bacterium]
MKRLVILALTAAMLLASVALAQAEVVVKARGEFQVRAMWQNNADLNKAQDGYDADDFNVDQRVRLDFRFVANENLEGVFYMEYGDVSWGQGGADTKMRLHDREVAIEVRRAYISWRWPDTDVLFNIGMQNIALPSAYSGSWILNDDVAAATVSTPITDMIAVTAGYARPYNYSTDGASKGADQIDLGFLAVPITPEGINFTPWFMYGYAGSNASNQLGDNGVPGAMQQGLFGVNNTGATEEGFNLYWAGAALTVDMFDPIVVMADFNWGQKTSSKDWLRRSGWFTDFAVKYTGIDFVTPSLVFAYGSGEDDDPSNGSERMPALNYDGGWSVGTHFFGNGPLSTDIGEQAEMGFWTIGLQLEDMTFIDKLSHSLYFVYAQGTNDHNLTDEYNSRMSGASNSPGDGLGGIMYGRTLFDKDNLYEIDFNHQYQIYDELAAILELNWTYISYDEDTWEKIDSSYGGVQQYWGCTLGMLYNF